jgi:radical SAM superfamily enzyme YgiQ (UPF0313 family)
MPDHPTHPKGKHASILLTSVFGPYAQDDQYGSRRINPMELYHNQVTRFQGPFSLRMFHRSFGLMLIQDNISAPCTLLDFPPLERFIQEIRENEYDVVGISAIIPNIGKVAKMCNLVRRYCPQATIVVGGHVTNRADIRALIDADHIVRGDGVAWFRKFLGQDPEAAVNHPMAYSANGTRILGVTLRDKPGDTAAVLIPSVGCPVGCNFCSTSALFGGKGHFINFYETGDALYEVMCAIENRLKVQSFFVLDENFLLHRKRALRLLELMQSGQKSWSLYVFSSARVLKSYTMEQLMGLGISWVWMGLEGNSSRYAKLGSVDTRKLVRSLQTEGIRVLGSSIIGLEDHRPEDMDRIITEAVDHAADFHQFMLYTPIPGTPLYAKHAADQTLLDETELSPADTHGQYRFNYRHAHIPKGEEEHFLHRAFESDFKTNGPSLARMIRTQLKGWQRHRHHADLRIRKRIAREAGPLATTNVAAVWAMARWYGKKDTRMSGRMRMLLKDLYSAFGWKTRWIAPLLGRYILIMLRKEHRRLQAGWRYEPMTFYEKNPAALAMAAVTHNKVKPVAAGLRWVTCRTQPVGR